MAMPAQQSMLRAALASMPSTEPVSSMSSMNFRAKLMAAFAGHTNVTSSPPMMIGRIGMYGLPLSPMPSVR